MGYEQQREPSSLQKIANERISTVNWSVDGTDALGSLFVWAINDVCDFRCEYCPVGRSSRSKERSGISNLSPQQIAEAFDKTGKSWEILLTGGEPLLHPRFVEICEALTRQHAVSINTHLPNGALAAFSRTIAPEKVGRIDASLHILEREKRDKGILTFVGNVKTLQDKGFRVRVVYVSYPPLFRRMPQDIQYLRSHGITTVGVKVFEGTYLSKVYPKAFTDEEKSLIRYYALDHRELAPLVKRLSFWGNRCSAGKNLMLMDPEGNLTRCGESFVHYGNLFDGTFRFDLVPRPCPFPVCRCHYSGMRFAEQGTSVYLSTISEMARELQSISFVKRKITPQKILRYLRNVVQIN